jgi:hypothetical protein
MQQKKRMLFPFALHVLRFTHLMYLHIGMNIYLRKERIIGIFPAAVLAQSPEEQPFLAHTTLVEHKVSCDEAKSCILTETSDLYLSNVNCRTLRQRWGESLKG